VIRRKEWGSDEKNGKTRGEVGLGGKWEIEFIRSCDAWQGSRGHDALSVRL
jgi:hypothetical protein